MQVSVLSRAETAATRVDNVSVRRIVREVSPTLTSDCSQGRRRSCSRGAAICDRAMSLTVIQLSVASYIMSCQLNLFSPSDSNTNIGDHFML